MLLARKVYELTVQYPEEEKFGLVSQMRRCCISIPSNIAEGYGRETEKEHAHFLYVSLGSSNELETQMILSYDFQYVSKEDYDDMMNLNKEINKMLSSLIFKVKHSDSKELKNS